MEKVICNGNNISYREQGQGEPVVLLHGFCGSSQYWDEVVSLLADEYRCIIPDLRGHGESDAPTGAYTVEDMAEDVVCLMDELELPTTFLLGHSLGGYITLGVAEQYESRLKGFGLIHSTAFADSEEVKAKRLQSVSTVQTQGITTLIDNLIPTLFAPDHVHTHPEFINKAKEIGYKTPPHGAIGVTIAMRERPDRRHVLVETDLPLLLVAGKEDGIIPVERTFTVDRPNVMQVIIENAGHMSMMEAPDELARHIKAYLQNVQ
ncbi:alpha/beta fold hydrolase [Paenibacillus sp. CMAA1364]